VALLASCQRHAKLAALLEQLLITGARVGEFLALQWSEDHGDELHFLNTKNGQVRRVQVTAGCGGRTAQGLSLAATSGHRAAGGG
jgi:integrase